MKARIGVPVFLGVLVLLSSVPAWSHHILGVPHYAYDEDYPQTPVLTYIVEAGSLKIEMTGYPGKPEPGERCSLHVYVRHADDGSLFDDVVTLTVMRDHFFGKDPVIYGPIEARLEESVYKFFPIFDEEANYLARIELENKGESWTIDLPMVAGDPGSPWVVLGSVAAGVTVFLVVIRALRIKMRRRAKASEQAPDVTASRNTARSTTP